MIRCFKSRRGPPWYSDRDLVATDACRYVGDTMIIPTLEGDHTASPGDWIIRGVKGELYPCKPDIFSMTYEPA